MASSGRYQSRVSLVSRQVLGKALHPWTRPPLQVLRPCRIYRPQQHGLHPPLDGEAVSDCFGYCSNRILCSIGLQPNLKAAGCCPSFRNWPSIPRTLVLFSPHIPLWLEYTVLFVFLVALLPCLWVSYIWDQVKNGLHLEGLNWIPLSSDFSTILCGPSRLAVSHCGWQFCR